MADFAVTSATALPFAANGQQALSRLRATARANLPASSVPDAFADQRRTRTGRTLNVAQARIAVETALIAGLGVISALKSLAGAFRLAADEGLSSNLTNLNLDGTRLSGVNITAQARRLVTAIDSLVDSAATSGANLIASGALRFTIQTTEFGGRITVSPQPLDSTGLGLGDLSGLTREDALSAVSRIEAAILVAQTRVNNLEVLRDGLIPGGSFSREIARIINSASTGFLPRGSLVNQTA